MGAVMAKDTLRQEAQLCRCRADRKTSERRTAMKQPTVRIEEQGLVVVVPAWQNYLEDVTLRRIQDLQVKNVVLAKDKEYLLGVVSELSAALQRDDTKNEWAREKRRQEIQAEIVNQRWLEWTKHKDVA